MRATVTAAYSFLRYFMLCLSIMINGAISIKAEPNRMRAKALLKYIRICVRTKRTA
ncbi:MAG: hypothetical protein J7K68_06470 [Candidatus Diapherotrites archaeon]|nr:hypothetical protein [Candidatus Diapherotrites archaeon]